MHVRVRSRCTIQDSKPWTYLWYSSYLSTTSQQLSISLCPGDENRNHRPHHLIFHQSSSSERSRILIRTVKYGVLYSCLFLGIVAGFLSTLNSFLWPRVLCKSRVESKWANLDYERFIWSVMEVIFRNRAEACENEASHHEFGQISWFRLTLARGRPVSITHW